jgi:hypothetical protein
LKNERLCVVAAPPGLALSKEQSRKAVMIMSVKATETSKILTGSGGAVLEDVPHLTDWLPDLPVRFFPFSLFSSYLPCAILQSYFAISLSISRFSDTISMNSHENLRTLSRLEFSTSHKTARTIRGIFGEKFAVVICVETLEALMSMVVNVPIVVSSCKLGRKEKMDQLNAISFLFQFFFQSDCRLLKARILSLAQDRPYNSWHLWREDCTCDLR